ncbi:hypothetical protein AYI69_g1689 [Smittium culicis]|uniref:Uncharacterized protein n=1 Tax=Smittium culicis TaxID=133412 RepID=A0A1R1YPJ4_9FUNG|nr:hypothetical protein AYI69_g1689 [Smittium culicis]
MEIDCHIDRTSDSEPVFLGAQAERNYLGNICGLPILLRFVESRGGVDAHQRQRVIGDFIRASTTERCWSFGIDLLRQYHNPSVHKEVWWNHLSEIARDFRKDLESLSEDEYSPSGYICTFCNESSRFTQPTHSTDRMVDIRPRVQEDIGTIWDTRCRPFRIMDEQEKLDISGSTESPQRTSNTNLSSPVMENGNMVPGSSETISLPTAIITGNHRNTRPKKRKLTAIKQQELMPYGVQNQRSFLKNQGLSDSANNIVVSNERSVKNRSSYHSMQQNFLG